MKMAGFVVIPSVMCGVTARGLGSKGQIALEVGRNQSFSVDFSLSKINTLDTVFSSEQKPCPC